jgi:hypothetical protein
VELFVFSKNRRIRRNNGANASTIPQNSPFRGILSARGRTFASAHVYSGIDVDSLDGTVKRGRVEGSAMKPAG